MTVDDYIKIYLIKNIIIVIILIQILGLDIVLFCYSMSEVESGEAEYHFNRLQL